MSDYYSVYSGGHDYAMFTRDGNAMVEAVVAAAINMRRDFTYVMSKLEILAETEAYSECLDTEVRETVYEVMNKEGLVWQTLYITLVLVLLH